MKNRRIARLCLTALLALLLPVQALAAGSIDLEQDCGLSLTYRTGRRLWRERCFPSTGWRTWTSTAS